MDYIKEINAFYDHDLVNQLSQSAGYLYLALLNMANRLFWKEGFMVSDVMLMARSGIKDRRTFNRAVQELVSFNLIAVREGRNSSSYTICGLASILPARNATLNETKNAASNATKDVAKDVTTIAANDAGHAWNAALFAEDFTTFSENPASNAALNAGYDASESPDIEPSSFAQTKLNKLNQTEILSATADTGQSDTSQVNNRTLIAELVKFYREVPGIAESKGDYSFIGALFNEFGYQAVFSAIHELTFASSGSEIEKPLLYLRAILKRAGPGTGPGPPIGADNLGEEDPLERYQRERYRG